MASFVRQPIASTSKCMLPSLPRVARRKVASSIADREEAISEAADRAVQDIDFSKPWDAINARLRRKLLMDTFGALGSTQTNDTGFKPHHTLTKPVDPSQVALDHILASTLHLGHSKRFHNRHATGAIYGRRNGVDIIDARQTLAALRRAAEVVRGVVQAGGAVVFMSALKGTEEAIRAAAKACGESGFSVTDYKEGFLTETERIYEGYDFAKLIGQRKKVTAAQLMPALIVVLTPRNYLDAISEANITRIPTIGLVDSDTDPRLVTYAIPGNDDSPRGIQLVAGVLGRAGQEGLERRQALKDLRPGEKPQSRAEIETVLWNRQVDQTTAKPRQPYYYYGSGITQLS